MVAEQEEEEGGLQWRIDAEVRLALQEAQAGEAGRLADLQARAAALEAALDQARSHEAKLEADVKAWQEALPARDMEIQNLQVSCHSLTPPPPPPPGAPSPGVPICCMHVLNAMFHRSVLPSQIPPPPPSPRVSPGCPVCCMRVLNVILYLSVPSVWPFLISRDVCGQRVQIGRQRAPGLWCTACMGRPVDSVHSFPA